MADYTLAKDGAGAIETTAAQLRIAASAAVRLACIGVSVEKDAGGDQVDIKIERTTGGTVSTTQTPEKMDIDSRAADTAGGTAFSVEPTLSGQPLLASDINDATTVGNPPVFMWWAHPRHPIIVGLSGFLSVMLRSGLAGNCTRSFTFLEPDRVSRCGGNHRRGIRRGYWHHQSYAQGHPGGSTAVKTWKQVSEFTMIQAETWPESFVPPNTALLFAVAAAPIFEDVDFFTPSSPLPELAVSVYG